MLSSGQNTWTWRSYLKNNIEAERRAQLANGGIPILLVGRQVRWEVPEVLSWAQCFGMYTTAVVGSHFMEMVKELLAYQTTIISEARRCGGRGWLLYNASFCKQVKFFESVNFSRVN